MKSLFASFSVAALAFTMFSPVAKADVVGDGLTLTINGAAVAGVYSPVLDAVVFTDTITNTSILSGGLLATSTSTITGTYTDVDGILGNLAVVDSCVSVSVLGNSSPCSDVTVVGTETGVGPLNLDAGTLTLLGANIALGPDGSILDASIGSANGNIQFGQPGGGDGDGGDGGASPVPEPGSLSLMATGLLGVAGAMRRKFLA